MDPREKDSKGRPGLTVHVLLEHAHLVTPPGHLGLQVLGLLLALADHRGEFGDHRLYHGLQILLPSELAL